MLLFLTSCHPRSHLLEPKIAYAPQKKQFHAFESPFPPLTAEEQDSAWGKELKIAAAFARDLDLYRAITGFKRALILMPQDLTVNRQQTQFFILQCYFLGKKYPETIDAFENTELRTVTSAFPAFRELLIMLYEAYLHTEQCEKAEAVMDLMEKGDPESALKLKLFASMVQGDLPAAASFAAHHPEKPDFDRFMRQYCQCKKSVRKAQTLNALLPGAGYYYVGQKKSALTSFVLNTTFIAAAYHFFDHGNWGAGMIATSFEFGWYFGGINGAGLAAKQYNQFLYEDLGKDFMVSKGLFPVLMLETSF